MGLVRAVRRRGGNDAVNSTREYNTCVVIRLPDLGSFCSATEKILCEHWETFDTPQVWHICVSGQCRKCGLWISGDELYALAYAPRAEYATAKTGRMRLGFCAREGCDGYDYKVRFWDQEEVDWPALLEEVDRLREREALEAKARKSLRMKWRNSEWPENVRYYGLRAGAVAACLAGLFVARQYYQGGAIPIIREAEQFQLQMLPNDPTWPMLTSVPD